MSSTSTRVELCRVSDVKVSSARKVETGDLVFAVYNVDDNFCDQRRLYP